MSLSYCITLTLAAPTRLHPQGDEVWNHDKHATHSPHQFRASWGGWQIIGQRRGEQSYFTCSTTELHALTSMAGVEPATTRLSVEVSLLYTAGLKIRTATRYFPRLLRLRGLQEIPCRTSWCPCWTFQTCLRFPGEQRIQGRQSTFQARDCS